jgi:hypothetical protein
MKKLNCMRVIVFVCATLVLANQTVGARAHRTNTQIIDFILSFQEQRIVAIAEAMPAEKYTFVPTHGKFKGVRSFAEQLKHIAADNYLLGAGILGEKPPAEAGVGESGSIAVCTKPEIIADLKASFAYMHQAAASIDEVKATIVTPEISPWPTGTATRLGVAIEDCLHTWDHYGQLVEYLRMNGIVPPSSRK